MRASRLLSLLLLLQLRGRVSAESLAAEFEVSVRTVYRDIDALSAAGVPVYAERGRHGGFTLRGGYQTRLTGLTAAEARALPLAGVGAAGTALGLGGETAAAQLKLLASLSPDIGADAAHVAARFHLDTLSWYSRAEDLQLLPVLAAAVWGDRRVRVDYSSWTQRRSRELDPLGLVLKSGLWYLVAASGGEPRSYRVGSIRALTTLEQRARRPRGFDLARYWRESTRRFEAALLSRRARLRVSPEGLQLLRDTMPMAVDTGELRASEPAADRGWREISVAVEQDAAAARQLLRLGCEVEVLAPASLRRAVIAEARRALAHYARRRRSA